MKRLTATYLLSLFLLLLSGGCADQTTDPLDNIPGALSFSVISGDDQSGEAGDMLPDPLVVEVTETKNGKTKPLTGYLVNFVVTEGGGSVFAGSAITTEAGLAQDYLTLGAEGCKPGVPCSNSVEVRAVDQLTGERLTFATFSATAIPISRIAVWGNTGIEWKGSAFNRNRQGQAATDDPILFRNIMQHLSGKTSEVQILWTDPCDPRTDPGVCYFGDLSYFEEFFETINTFATVTYSMPSSVDLADYDVVVADFCSPLSDPAQFAEVDIIESYLSERGPALVLGDEGCGAGGVRSFVPANALLADYGIQLINDPAYTWAPLVIPPAEQVGLLSGVATLQLWRELPLDISSGFEPVASVGVTPIVAVQSGQAAGTG